MIQPPMMQQPIFKFYAEARDDDVRKEEASSTRTEADALLASSTSSENATASPESVKIMQEEQLLPAPVEEALDERKDEADAWRKDEVHPQHAEVNALLTSSPSPQNSTSSPKSKVGVSQWEVPIPVVEDHVDDRCLADCVGVVADPHFETRELVDAGAKCNSVVGENADYRSGMAREAVACLLKNSMAANKAYAKKASPQSDFVNCIHSADNSTAASSTVASRGASVCPTQRLEKPQSWHASPAFTTFPATVEKRVGESVHCDEWANDHLAVYEHDAQPIEAASAEGVGEAGITTAEDECRSYVSAIICSPIIPPLEFPTNGSQEQCDPVVAENIPGESDSNLRSAHNEVQTKEACGE